MLKRYRVAAGLTQEALAERTRVSPRTISDLERGVTSWPYRDTVALLAAALELTADERATLQVARRRPLGRVASRSTEDPAPALASGNAPEPAAGPVDPPSHLRTFLVADIPGYTRFAHEHGDAAVAQLAARFAALVGEGVALQGGRVVELRGDEAVAAFGSARQALRAALDLQERCAQVSVSAPQRDPGWPLSMGIGLDAGEAIPVEGGYRGVALNLAAQLCGMAVAGEVLASAGVAHLARKTEGLVYLDRGEVMLESLGDVVRVIQVLPAGAVSEADARIVDVSNLLPVTLLAKLRTSHVLFLGYSLREWNQRVIVHRLWGEQKLSDNYKCWVLHVDVQPIDRGFWSKRDVANLPVHPDEYIAVLSERVQALARAGTGA